MTDHFYRAFEERFRGTQQAILERQKVYLPFLRCLLQEDAQASAIDLGCGRGEWLELLTAEGLHASGCDLDMGMLAGCTERGLKVEHTDALAFLHAQPEERYNLVSAFHLAEHLPFEQLRDLITQAERVLKPGGLLLLETPNPENISVGSCSFYLDPTHKHPLPPPLLGFMAEYAGFARITTLRLQEESPLHDDPSPGLFKVLTGVSPDYAIIAQKQAHEDSMQPFDALFQYQTGLSLPELADRHDLWWQRELHRVEHDSHELAKGALERHHVHEQRIIALEQLKQTLLQQQLELQQIYNSRSWRLLEPLRWTMRQWRQLRADGLPSRVRVVNRRLAATLLPRLSHWLKHRPKLKRWVLIILRRLGLFDRLSAVYRAGSAHTQDPGTAPGVRDLISKQQGLPTPGAREFYAQLKQAMAQRGDT